VNKDENNKVLNRGKRTSQLANIFEQLGRLSLHIVSHFLYYYADHFENLNAILQFDFGATYLHSFFQSVNHKIFIG